MLAFFLSAGLLVYRDSLTHHRYPEREYVSPEEAAAAPATLALARHPIRPVYPYSVIPSGAYSAAELDADLAKDPVAAAHYASFHRGSVSMTHAAAQLLMYASYRREGSVYWTSQPMHIAAGEPLITDGTSLARARCGNRLSDSPLGPVSRTEPAETEMDTPAPFDFGPFALKGTTAAVTSTPNSLTAAASEPAPSNPESAYEMFPTAPVAMPGFAGIAGAFPFLAAALSPTGTANSAASLSLSPSWSALPSFYPIPYSPAPISGPGNSGLTVPTLTIQQTVTPATVLKVPQVPPALPGVITGINGFPGQTPLEPAPRLANPNPLSVPPPPSTTSNPVPPTGNAPPPGQVWPQGASPAGIIPGADIVPEPITGPLVCAALVFLFIAAKRRRAA